MKSYTRFKLVGFPPFIVLVIAICTSGLGNASVGEVTDLGLQLAASGNFPKALDVGTSYPVSLKARNYGPVTATSTTINVTLPEGVTASGLSNNCKVSSAVVTCTNASFGIGKKFNVAFKIKASESAIGSAVISAQITSAETDSASENNSLTSTIAIGSIYDISLTKSGNQNGTITSAIGLDCGDVCQITVKSKKAAGDKVILKAVPSLRNKLVRWTGSTCKSTSPVSCTLSAKSGQSYTIDGSFAEATDEKVVLLLHGMNSDTSTWKDYVKKNFSACYTVSNGVIVNETGKKFPVNCYAVKFGAYDATGNAGLEDARKWANKYKLPTAGDFSTFDQLGKEVDKAVAAITAYHPGAHILMIGHSRGGLAARAFLNNKTTAAPYNSVWTDYIDGLITTGTPHDGSPVGRIYAYLTAHPRDSCGFFDGCTKDWLAVDELAFLLRSVNSGLDARRPVIGYLATGSNQLNKLNSGVLPSTVVAGQIRYGGLALGKLSKSYDIFPYGRNGGKVSILAVGLTNSAIDFMLGTGVNSTNSALLGDGIVPVSKQAFSGSAVDKVYANNKVLHTDEPKKATDINSMICKLSSPSLPAISFTDWVRCP